MPIRWLVGTPSTWRVSSIAWPSRALPSFERCERPSDPIASFSGAQPGGFAQGPEEKKGRAGRASGFGVRHNNSPRRERAPRWDGVARRRD